MNRYSLTFYGRPIGSLGIMRACSVLVDARNEHEARILAYESHEHIHGGLAGVTVKQIDARETANN